MAALSGLGGVGKTQIAVEHAYRQGPAYDEVLWIPADSRLSLGAGFSEVAKALGVRETGSAVEEVVRAVHLWLESHDRWLLVFDNADQPKLLQDYIPHRPRGHLLLTSRAQVFDVLGIASPVEIRPLPPDEALDFLLRRTGRTGETGEERAAAASLATELGGLPLALEQAGAFLITRQARFQDYLESYRTRRVELLRRSPPVTGDASKSVATTWAMNFREVEATSRASSDLLHLSAFLSPDAIPAELIILGAPLLGDALSRALEVSEGDPLIFNELLEPLTRYSLVRYAPQSRSFSLHRLVQEVVREAMTPSDHVLWARRAIIALNRVFPSASFSDWPACNRLIGHVKAVSLFIPGLEVPLKEAAELLDRAGIYSYRRAQYGEAMPFLRLALGYHERSVPVDPTEIATSLNNLAEAARALGHYSEAETLHKRSLAIRARTLGPDHPALGTGLHNLAEVYRAQGRLARAEKLHRHALAVRERALGRNHPDVGKSLNTLGETCRDQGKYEEAEPLLQRSLSIREKVHGPDHPNVATSLDILAMLYYAQGRYSQAEPLLQRSLTIRERALGGRHPFVAFSLNDLAEVYRAQGRFGEAEELHLHSLAIRRETLGDHHPFVARTVSNLGMLYFAQRRFTEAEPLLLQALAIRESLGPGHPDLAASLNFLGQIYAAEGRMEEAERLYRRALAFREEALGPAHPVVATSLANLAALCAQEGRLDEAEALNRRSWSIREASLGAGHPYLAFNLSTLGEICRARGRLAEARSAFESALEIRERALGPHHPEVARTAAKLAEIRQLADPP